MIDLRDQKIIRDKRQMLKHLRTFDLDPNYSIGVWYFYPAGGRFHEPYVKRKSIKEVLRKIGLLYDREIVNSKFGLEAHYPNEINENLIDEYKSLQKETGIRVISIIPNLFYERIFEFGSLSNNNLRIRGKAIKRTIEALKMNVDLNTEFAVIWPGIDGYENPIGTNFLLMWKNFEYGLAEAIDAVPGTRVAIEPKPYEPRGNNIYRNTPNGILMARNVESLLRRKENIRLLDDDRAIIALNPEVGHVLMGHEELAYALASIMREGRLAHIHWNSQPLGNYDQDLNVGVMGIDQAYAALLVLKMYGYRGRFGIDINPERMPIETALILNTNALKSAIARINKDFNYDKLVEAMYDPQNNRGIAEDVMIRALAPRSISLIDL